MSIWVLTLTPEMHCFSTDLPSTAIGTDDGDDR